MSEQKLKKHLECPICTEILDKPRVLPCLHVFCQKCLEDYVSVSSSLTLKCPVCRKEIPLPPLGVQGFPTHFLVNSLLETLEETKTKCDECEPTEADLAVSGCTVCQKFLCEIHTFSHKKGRITKSHKISSIDELEDQKQAFQYFRPQFCSEHVTEELKYYCDTCFKPICRDCVVLFHQGHKNIALKEASSKSKTNLEVLLKQLKSHMENLKALVGQLDKTSETVKIQNDLFHQELKTKFKQFHQYLEERENLLHVQLDIAWQAQLQDISTRKEPLTKCLQEVHSCHEFSTRVLSQGTVFEILSLKGTLEERIQELSLDMQKSTHELSEINIGTASIEIDPTLLLSQISNLGQIVIKTDSNKNKTPPNLPNNNEKRFSLVSRNTLTTVNGLCVTWNGQGTVVSTSELPTTGTTQWNIKIHRNPGSSWICFGIIQPHYVKGDADWNPSLSFCTCCDGYPKGLPRWTGTTRGNVCDGDVFMCTADMSAERITIMGPRGVNMYRKMPRTKYVLYFTVSNQGVVLSLENVQYSPK